LDRVHGQVGDHLLQLDTIVKDARQVRAKLKRRINLIALTEPPSCCCRQVPSRTFRGTKSLM